MIKLKVLSGVLSLAVLCSTSIASAESKVVGQLIASPSAVINAGATQQKVGSQATAYIQGDTITTGSDASATVSLSSGVAKLVVAPNTLMAVTNASDSEFLLTRGAFNVQASGGQTVTVNTSVGSFELVSESFVNAIASFENGEFAVISKNGLLTVASQAGAVISIDAGNAYVYNDKGASSLNVQAAETVGSTALNTGLIIGGVVITTAVVAEEVSDAGDSEVEEDSASPAE